MRLNAQELSVRKTGVFQRTRSNFTLSSTDSASGGPPNATRHGAYSGTACSACGSSAAAASDTVLLDANRDDRNACIRGRSRYRDVSRPPSSIASGKTLSTVSRVARARGLPTGANNERKVLDTAVLTKPSAKGNPACSLAARNTSSRSLGRPTPESIGPFTSLAWRIVDCCLCAK